MHTIRGAVANDQIGCLPLKVLADGLGRGLLGDVALNLYYS